ncbi:MAG: periplasmic heavy metal sensor [Armatimonadota bacterium]|nr:periplasmic heavy metal sensor [Armatimonadota bacterium]MDR7464803.1 periplasmic heavy metal sensor [Armatimonadota bacterium]MDR7470120.1 periplasmic heavy metal sensor [Armatimonadota bacterium]MDR7537917.1 periplasmic heavy metal sensor [Armatimonadota bacterium]
MRRWILLLAPLLAVAIAAGVVTAQPAPPPPGAAGLPPFLARFRTELNLSDDQVNRLSQAYTTYRTRTERLRLDLARARLDLREAFLAPTPDRARVEAVARRIGGLQDQLTQARIGLLLEIRTILTPQQAERLRALWRQQRARRWPGRWRW